MFPRLDFARWTPTSCSLSSNGVGSLALDGFFVRRGCSAALLFASFFASALWGAMFGAGGCFR